MLLVKKSNYLVFFPAQIWAICYFSAFFLVLSTCCMHYFPDPVTSLMNILYCTVHVHFVLYCTVHFFLTKNFFNTKIMVLFEAGQIYSNFSFLVTYKALTLYLPEKMQHPPNFLMSIFDYQVFSNKHINVIKIFHNSNNSRMCWSHDLTIY